MFLHFKFDTNLIRGHLILPIVFLYRQNCGAERLFTIRKAATLQVFHNVNRTYVIMHVFLRQQRVYFKNQYLPFWDINVNVYTIFD